MVLRSNAGAISLAVEFGSYRYDVADAVLCIRTAAVAALVALYLSETSA
jgi:hypothetical protein